MLIENNADINARNKLEDAPLHFAARFRKTMFLNLLKYDMIANSKKVIETGN